MKFRPLDGYFFGAENRMPDDTVNYYLRALAFPQQSTVLGAVRYMLLLKAGDDIFKDNRIIDSSAAADLIGHQSFDMRNKTSDDFKFGIIKSISEVFLISPENEIFLPAPFDHSLSPLAQVDENLYRYEDYNPKKDVPVCFMNGSKKIDKDAIFGINVVSGNKKNNKGDDDDDSFYKQEIYYLKKGWSFGVRLEFNEDNSEKFTQAFEMKMGGENKLFRFEKTDLDYKAENILNDCSLMHPEYTRVLLLSDTFYSQSDVHTPDFAFIKTRFFRHLRSDTAQTKHYYNRASIVNPKSENGTALESSQLYELAERGSVFYFKDAEKAKKFSESLEMKYLIHSGMNASLIINPKP